MRITANTFSEALTRKFFNFIQVANTFQIMNTSVCLLVCFSLPTYDWALKGNTSLPSQSKQSRKVKRLVKQQVPSCSAVKRDVCERPPPPLQRRLVAHVLLAVETPPARGYDSVSRSVVQVCCPCHWLSGEYPSPTWKIMSITTRILYSGQQCTHPRFNMFRNMCRQQTNSNTMYNDKQKS